MSLHDAFARQTPFELAFPDQAGTEALFEQMSQEAEARGSLVDDPGQFMMLGAVGACLRDLPGQDGPGGAFREYGALVYHAFHFARCGYPLHLLSTPVARYLVGGSPSDTPPAAPAEAGYLQLPQHLFWTSIAPDEPPQSVDGLFWAAGPRGFLYVLLVLGLRGDAGLMVVPLPEAPWDHRAAWLTEDMRAEGDDFASGIPGAELDGLYAFESPGEVLKLLARLFAYMERVPEACVTSADRDGAGERTESDPKPSVLPFTRVELHG